MSDDITAKNFAQMQISINAIDDVMRCKVHAKIMQVIGADAYKSWIYPMAFVGYHGNTATYKARSFWWRDEVIKRHLRVLKKVWAEVNPGITHIKINGEGRNQEGLDANKPAPYKRQYEDRSLPF